MKLALGLIVACTLSITVAAQWPPYVRPDVPGWRTARSI